MLRILVVVAAAVLSGCAGFFPQSAQVTPQRPTFSSNTATTAEGTLELEAGGAIDPGDSIDTPLVAKWGTGPGTELFAGWSPLQYLERPGPDGLGVSDLVLGTRHRFIEEGDGTPSMAVQLATKLPSGDSSEGLSTDQIDFNLAAILTQTFGSLEATVYYNAGFLGQGVGDPNLQHLLALAAGLPINDRIGAFGELTGIIEHERSLEEYYFIGGATYSSEPGVMFDLGARIGLNDDAADFALLFGFTTNFGPASSWGGGE